MIKKTQNKSGFSLTEVLLAIGTLAVGMLFIAGVFPVGIHFTTVATERTTAAIVADEAFAKIKLYGNQYGIGFVAPSDISQTAFELPTVEHAYPSTTTANPITKKYWWSAVCRRIGPAEAQVTVFVSRKAGVATRYYGYDVNRPDAVPVTVSGMTGGNELTITINKTFINDGSSVVDGVTGQIHRVLQRYPAPDNLIRLEKPWRPDLPSQVLIGSFWVVPPPIGGGKYPCIAIYQKVMRF